MWDAARQTTTRPVKLALKRSHQDGVRPSLENKKSMKNKTKKPNIKNVNLFSVLLDIKKNTPSAGRMDNE